MITVLYKTRLGTDSQALRLLKEFSSLGYQELKGIKRELVLRVESASAVSLEKLQTLFCYPGLEIGTTESVLVPSEGPILEVAYQRSITDPETASIMHIAPALGLDITWARLAVRYQFFGIGQAMAEEIITRHLCNAQVECVIPEGEKWSTLIPQGTFGQVEYIDMAGMSASELSALSLSRRLMLRAEQLLAIKKFTAALGRPLRDGEIEMTSAAWGDHCDHSTWKALGLLQHLRKVTARINHPLVLSAFDDNAGVMEFYDGWALNLKGETHISPTSVSPYGGIMTEHGGVIRDILDCALGAWPWASCKLMGVADPRLPWGNVLVGSLHPSIILRESIRGTKDYTNPMGIPMAWSQYLEHPNNVKCFALGHSVGILPADKAQKGVPRPGDLVVLIGGPTGRDGIHGATVSSGSMTQVTATVDASHVQIGMPIEERKVMETVVPLRDAGCIRARADGGAAGLSSAAGEMGSHTGIWVNLAWVPLKCADMMPYEIWISESQERDVLCIPQDKWSTAKQILSDYDVVASVIGIFTDTHCCQVVYDKSLVPSEWMQNPTTELTGDIVVDLPYDFLTKGGPLPNIAVSEPKRNLQPFLPHAPRNQSAWIDLVRTHLGHFNICDQSVAAHQFDQTVQGNTVLSYIGGKDDNMPDELFVATPVRGKLYGGGIAVATNQFYGEVNPAGMGRLIMAQAVTRLVAAGFSPDDIVCCANVYSPSVLDEPEKAWDLRELVMSGYARAELELGTPVISGKDSSSGTFKDEGRGIKIPAPLTLCILALGRMPDVRQLIRKPFLKPGDRLVLYQPGLKYRGLGGSVFLDSFGQRGDALSEVNLTELRQGLLSYHRFLGGQLGPEKVHSRSVIVEGGLIRRLFEMGIGSGLGCQINLPDQPLRSLFSEPNTAMLLAVPSIKELSQLEGGYQLIGEVTSSPTISVDCGGHNLFSVELEELSTRWATNFKEVVI
ncbi:TPA: hypothetical protein DIC39_00765 [Patescibacteria group bacterium]|nr:hypothetical protein [Patescibacteria group bacterium]